MPRSSRTARAIAGAIAIAAAASLAACGPGVDPNADIENGKALFTKSCAGCHALKDAGSAPDPAKVGPSLDDSFRASRQDGFKESEFEANIRRWIADAAQKPARVAPYATEAPLGTIMPRDIVVGQEAQDVAAYVARVAGKDAEDSPVFAADDAAPATGGAPQPEPAPDPTAAPAVEPGVIAPPPVDGVQSVPLPENPTEPVAGSRIVGPWVSTTLRDRRISRLKPAVAARSYPVDQYLDRSGYWIQINPQ